MNLHPLEFALMARPPADLSQRMTTPWAALALALAGGALMGRDIEPVFRLSGLVIAAAGAAILAHRAWRNRQTMAQVLAAIPVPDKTEALLSHLPKVWAAMEEENLALRNRAATEDQVRRHVLNHLKVGVVLLDQGRAVRIFNPAARGLLGSSSNLEAGASIVAAFREPGSLRCLEQAFQGEPAEWTLPRASRTLQLRALPLPDPARPEVAEPWVLVTLDDITRQEALETTRQKFISNASHELKTPVTSIRIAVENIQDGGLAEDNDPNLRLILRAVTRMTLLLDDISELSRIETGALQLVPAALQLGPFLDDLLGSLADQGAARQVRVRADLPEALRDFPFEADPLRLAQVLENLLGNAIKFSPAGAEVRLQVFQEGSWLVWNITDEGPGIAKAEAGRIFERFYRAPSARAIPGTGLGLAIVKHLALLMGGEVALHSELGKGATFTFRQPLADNKLQPSFPTREVPCPAP